MLEDLKSLRHSYKKSAENAQAPIEDYIEDFNDLIIGTSFNPEHIALQGAPYDYLAPIKMIQNDLGIRQIRIAIRWDKVDKDGNIDFEYYRNYFNRIFYGDFDEITINFGPIKTMRWPEEPIPQRLQVLVKQKDTITSEHPLATYALNYLEQLCKFIREEYKDQLQKIKIVQGDNELFNRFGQFKLGFSNEFEAKVIKVLIEYFPDAKILINSNGRKDLNRIFALIKEFDQSRFIIGLNYYYKVPVHYKIPIVNKLDGITLSPPWSMSIEQLKKKGVQVEISELQGEPWLPATTPGNNFQEFLFTLYRAISFKPQHQTKLLVRYWGIEDFIHPFLIKEETIEKKKIRELIMALNSRET